MKPWERELKRLRVQNLALQRQAVLQDPLLSGKTGAVLTRYLDALAWIVEVSDANRGRSYEDTSKPTGHSSVRPNPIPAWAADVLKRELRWVERQTRDLEQWVEAPYGTRRSGKTRRRCGACNRGLARGHAFCSGCGTEAERSDGSEGTSGGAG